MKFCFINQVISVSFSYEYTATMSESRQDQPVFFWRETDSHTGYLSQWYYCPFRDDKNPDRIYETAEQ